MFGTNKENNFCRQALFLKWKRDVVPKGKTMTLNNKTKTTNMGETEHTGMIINWF